MTTLPPIKLRETKEIDGETHMRCSKCRTWKPEDQFSPNKFTRCGRQSHCHECKNAYHKVQRAKAAARKAQKRAVEKAFTKAAPTYPKPVKTRQKPNTRQRKAIKPVSDKRKNWLKQYEAKKKADPTVVQAWRISGWKPVIENIPKSYCEPHHPLGRIGCRTLFYVWTSPELHAAIHDSPKWAREEGLLLPEYDGRESGPDQKDPFNILPEYRAYVAEHGLH